MSGRTTIAVLLPHRDDAVISIGSILAGRTPRELVSHGDMVEVVELRQAELAITRSCLRRNFGVGIQSDQEHCNGCTEF